MNIDMIQQLAARSPEFSAPSQHVDGPDDKFAARLKQADASGQSTAVDGARSSRGRGREEAPVSAEPETRGEGSSDDQAPAGAASEANRDQPDVEDSARPPASDNGSAEPKPESEGPSQPDSPNASASPVVGPVQVETPTHSAKPVAALPEAAAAPGSGVSQTHSARPDEVSPRSPSPTAQAPRAILPPVALPPVTREQATGSGEAELPQLIRSLADVTRPADVKPVNPVPAAEAKPIAAPIVEALTPQTEQGPAVRPAPGTAPAAGQSDSGTSNTSSDSHEQAAGRQLSAPPPLLAAAEAETAASASAPTETSPKSLAPPPAVPTTATPIAVEASALTAEAPAPSASPVSAPVAEAPDLAETQVESQRVAEQALKGLRSVMGRRGGNVTLQLHPRELGSLRIQVQMEAGVVRAQFIAANDSSQSLLQQQLGTLRAALQAQGLVVDQLSVQSSGLAQDSGADAEQADDDG
ncbi:MAG: flagellar hook-length control protein FliK, partial [Phycisphaerae bacterium]|nr:flagellar hook-length control protein FliK [Phycisphaerae bacterium]